ncbi:MAG: hypothetical protein SH807_10285 [Blastochloris sp.]|nr:hypothetical protein [Blastochloris sp.]
MSQLSSINDTCLLDYSPFSRARHWLSLTVREESGKPILYLSTSRGGVPHRTLISLAFSDSAAPEVLPEKLTLTTTHGGAEFAFDGERTLRIRVRGQEALRLQVYSQPYSSSFPCESGRWHLNLNATRARLMVTALSGSIEGHAPFISGKSDTEPALLLLHPEAGCGEFEITEFASTWIAPQTRPSFEAVVESAQADFAQWLDGFGEFPERWRSLARSAAFNLWSNTMPAGGNYSYAPVMMSQNAMTSVWSWDHCFVALALRRSHPRLAWKQWWLPFALQTEEGMLPDAFDDVSVDFGMTKPPVHGRTLLQILPFYTPTPTEVDEAYTALEKWTNWWFAHRDDDHDGIPQYNHGCESGWDNDSVCCGGLPAESPDISVYLIEQMEALAVLAERRGTPELAVGWRERADKLLEKLIRHSWSGETFLTMQSGTHHLGNQGDCLRQFWPLLLGKQLPATISAAQMAHLLEPGRFRTSYGFASESPLSSHYQADGYWLGPIWAPSTHQVVEMLLKHGQDPLAWQTAEDFCKLCQQHGFRENFNALTGEGLRDHGYAWTAAVCLDFLHNAHQFPSNLKS